MATFYIPSTSGWASLAAGSGYSSYAGAGRMRIKVEQTYDASTNKSTLVFSVEVYSTGYSGNFVATQGATLTVNGNTVKTFAEGVSANTYRVTTDQTATWRQLKSTNGPNTWSVTVSHAVDGSASVTAGFSGILAYSVSGTTYGMRWNSSASLDISVTRTFTLSLSADSHSTISVTSGGTALHDGDTITYGTSLSISVSADNGYQIASSAVNGTSFSGSTSVTVTGDVSVVATSEAAGLVNIYVNGSWAKYAPYVYDGGAWARVAPYVYDDGAWAMHGG